MQRRQPEVKMIKVEACMASYVALSFSRVDKSTEGSYYYTVENDAGSDISKCTTLTIGELHCCVKTVLVNNADMEQLQC